MKKAAPLLGCVVLSIGACGSPQDSGTREADEQRSPQPRIRDSLGVTVVEHVSPLSFSSASVGWEVHLADTVRIGSTASAGDDPEYQIGRAVGAARLRDGRVAVADGQASQIRVFRANGSFSSLIGRPGEGPGEFSRVTGLFRFSGDSLWVVQGRAQWTLLGPLGHFVDQGRMDLAHWPGVEYPIIQGAFSDGTLLVTHGYQQERAVREWGWSEMSTHEFYRATRQGRVLASFGRFPQKVRLLVDEEHMGAPISGSRGPVRYSSQPGPAFAVNGGRFYWADAGLGEVRIFRLDGSLERIVRFPRGSDGRSYAPLLVDHDVDPVVVDELERLHAAGGPFASFAVDDGGNLWLKARRTRGEDQSGPARWHVFDSAGRRGTTVDLPRTWRGRGALGGDRHLNIGTDYILARERDELSVETYVLVPLNRH